MDIKEFLNQLLASLNQIEVKGKDNLDVLLGCIIAVNKAIKELDEEVTDNG